MENNINRKKEVNEKQLDSARQILIETIPLSEYLNDNNLTYHSNKYGKICCPIHEESTPSCIYDDEKSVFNCFGCGKGGSVVELHLHIARKDNSSISYLKAILDLAKTYNIDIPDVFSTEVVVVPNVTFNKKTRYSQREDIKQKRYEIQLQRASNEFKNTSPTTRFAIAKILNRYYLDVYTAEQAVKAIGKIKTLYNQKMLAAMNKKKKN